MKKLISSILIGAALLVQIPLTASANGGEIPRVPFRVGDVDGDGEVTVVDALHILRYIIGLPNVIDGSEPFAAGVEGTPDDAKRAAGITKSGSVSISDGLEVLRSVISLPNLVPPPTQVPQMGFEDTRLNAINAIVETGTFTMIFDYDNLIFHESISIDRQSLYRDGERVRIEFDDDVWL
ncbi:MAG: dockerin type I domain-containing protein, partial [Oscillospiraceae bacterium]|nr:dockerin type I domain-containing protein [Oscillospiraceae bacterium]